MFFILKNVTNPLCPVVIETFDTHLQAVNRLEQIGVIFMEEDAEYPFCVDALGENGDLFVIEPDQIA
jgi:hypothetical protein